MAENWTDDELAAAVEAYIEMAELEAGGKAYSKRNTYRDLAQRFSRTEKAFEYRMQNISAVLHELGESWIPGLNPAANVGANVKSRLVSLLRGLEQGSEIVARREAPYKRKLPAIREWLIEVARHKRQVTYGEVMAAFGIDRFTLRHAMDFLGHQAKDLGEPIITALIVSKTTGQCSSGMAKEFDVHDDDAERQHLYRYWKTEQNLLREAEMPAELEVEAARFASIEIRPNQAAFRRKVYLAHNGRCVISGCNVRTALDAAHKHGRDWRLGHNHAEDGYLLRKDLHALYDNKLLSITDEGKVELDSSVMDYYQQFAAAKISDGVPFKD